MNHRNRYNSVKIINDVSSSSFLGREEPARERVRDAGGELQTLSLTLYYIFRRLGINVSSTSWWIFENTAFVCNILVITLHEHNLSTNYTTCDNYDGSTHFFTSFCPHIIQINYCPLKYYLHACSIFAWIRRWNYLWYIINQTKHILLLNFWKLCKRES